jgi:hypothetical protein
MSKKYYSDDELIELCLLYFNLKVPFSEKEFVDASRREKAKWHPDRAPAHRQEEFNTYLQAMNPISAIILEKIQSSPTLFQKTLHNYTSQHIGQVKPVAGASAGGGQAKSTREPNLEKDILTKNAEIETLKKKVLAVETELTTLIRQGAEKDKRLKDLHTKELSQLNKNNSTLILQLETLKEKMAIMKNDLKISEEKRKNQGSAAQVLDIIGLGKHADLASSQNIETIKGVVDTVKFLSNVFKK